MFRFPRKRNYSSTCDLREWETQRQIWAGSWTRAFNSGWSLGEGLSFLLRKLRSLTWMVSLLSNLLRLCKHVPGREQVKLRYRNDWVRSRCSHSTFLWQSLCFKERNWLCEVAVCMPIWRQEHRGTSRPRVEGPVSKVSGCILGLKGTLSARRSTGWTELFDPQNIKVGGHMIDYKHLFSLHTQMCQAVVFYVETEVVLGQALELMLGMPPGPGGLCSIQALLLPLLPLLLSKGAKIQYSPFNKIKIQNPTITEKIF